VGYDAEKFHLSHPTEEAIYLSRRAAGRVMWKHVGAALGRVAMRAKLVRADKAALSLPTRSSQDSPWLQA
jgi:hypothetical protein